jgi:hydrogenase maturation protease
VTSSLARAESTTTDTSTEAAPARVLVGGVGYRFLRDDSVGPYVSDLLAERTCEGIEIEDVSYHPVGLSQNLTERPAYKRVVLVAAVRRARPPGNIASYHWDGALPSRDEIQERVSEAVTGVISLDNLLIVCGALGGLPDDVRVVEIEPGEEGWGEGFSPEIESRLPELIEVVWTSAKP